MEEMTYIKKPKRTRHHRIATTTVGVTLPKSLLQTLQANASREVRSLEEQILWCVLQGLKKEISPAVAQSEEVESHAN